MTNERGGKWHHLSPNKQHSYPPVHRDRKCLGKERGLCCLAENQKHCLFPSCLPHAGSDGWVMGLFWQVALIFITTNEKWSQWSPMAKWLGGDVTLISLKTSAGKRSQSLYIDLEHKCWSKIGFLRLQLMYLNLGTLVLNQESRSWRITCKK